MIRESLTEALNSKNEVQLTLTNGEVFFSKVSRITEKSVTGVMRGGSFMSLGLDGIASVAPITESKAVLRLDRVGVESAARDISNPPRAYSPRPLGHRPFRRLERDRYVA